MIKIHEQECLHLFALHILGHRTIPYWIFCCHCEMWYSKEIGITCVCWYCVACRWQFSWLQPVSRLWWPVTTTLLRFGQS